jgi:hypothetical protein
MTTGIEMKNAIVGYSVVEDTNSMGKAARQ